MPQIIVTTIWESASMNRIGIIIDIMVELRIESPLGHVIWVSTSGVLSILLLNIDVCH